MKSKFSVFFALSALFVSSQASFAAATDPDGFTINSATFNVKDQRAVDLFNALKAQGATASSEDPKYGPLILIRNMLIDIRSHSKDFSDPADPCYEKPAVKIQFQQYGVGANINNSPWITINGAQNCSGAQSDLAKQLIKALVAVGLNRVSGDDAMGGESGQTITNMFAGPNLAAGGASGDIGGRLDNYPQN